MTPGRDPDPDSSAGVSGDDPGVTDDAGTYVLHVRVPDPVDVTVGALGDHRLPAGGYGYVGSALGPGGFARVDRHREVATGERDVRHWHVDALLGHPDAVLAGTLVAPGAGVECEFATAIRERIAAAARPRPDSATDGEESIRSSPGAGTPVPAPGFGASDCDCPGHLVRERSVETLRATVAEAADAIGVAVERY